MVKDLHEAICLGFSFWEVYWVLWCLFHIIYSASDFHSLLQLKIVSKILVLLDVAQTFFVFVTTWKTQICPYFCKILWNYCDIVLKASFPSSLLLCVKTNMNLSFQTYSRFRMCVTALNLVSLPQFVSRTILMSFRSRCNHCYGEKLDNNLWLGWFCWCWILMTWCDHYFDFAYNDTG